MGLAAISRLVSGPERKKDFWQGDPSAPWNSDVRGGGRSPRQERGPPSPVAPRACGATFGRLRTRPLLASSLGRSPAPESVCLVTWGHQLVTPHLCSRDHVLAPGEAAGSKGVCRPHPRAADRDACARPPDGRRRRKRARSGLENHVGVRRALPLRRCRLLRPGGGDMGQHRRDATRGGRTVPLRLAQAGAAEPRPRLPPSSVSGPACRLLERPRGRLSRDCGDLERQADPLGCCPEDDPTRLSEREPEADPTTDGSACWGRSRGPRRRRRSPAPSSPGGRRPGAAPQRLSPPAVPWSGA